MKIQKDMKRDLKKFPKLMYDMQNRTLTDWDGVERSDYRWHHFVKQQVYCRNPEQYKDIQKMIYLPTFTSIWDNKMNCLKMANMHAEADNFHSKFKERWGVGLEEVIYRG